jgi:membrane-associated PAP2 superfamily phosphatase
MTDAPCASLPRDQRWRELGFLLAVAVLLTPIFWLTNLDIRAAGWFYEAGLAEPWFAKDALICQIFFYAPPVLIGAIVVLAAHGFVTGGSDPLTKGRRRGAVIMLVAVLLGPGILVNAIFKNHWGRPRPNAIEQFGGKATYLPPLLKAPAGGKSFPSGHPSMAFVYAVFYLLLREKHRRRARVMLAAALLLGLAMGVARMAAGAHFLSDVLWSMLITWFAAWAAYYGVMALDARMAASAKEGRRLGLGQWLAISASVAVIVAGLLFITPVNRKAAFEWPSGKPVPATLVVRAPGAVIKVRVEPATAAGGAAFGLKQTVQGFGLPWNRLRVRQDKTDGGPVATWTYEAQLRGAYTELDNVLTITVRDPAVRVLKVETSDGAHVELEGEAGWLEIVQVPAGAAAGK